jgi:hypothetical protein
MTDERFRNKLVEVGRAEQTAQSLGGSIFTKAVLNDAARTTRQACRTFARAVDWQYVACARNGDSSPAESVAKHRLSENHEGLHSGMFITVSVLKAAHAVAIKGGYYDSHWQPTPVYRESIPLKEATAQALGHLLVEMHERLGRCERAEAA